MTGPSAQAAQTSSAEDQLGVELTVYNGSLGLVKDTRRVSLPAEEGEMQFMDVAASLMPETVHVKSLNHPGELSVLEQNYEYDLINEQKLLDKYVGKQVKLIEVNEYQDRKTPIEATLLSNNGGPIYKIGNEIYLGYPGLKVLPEIPANLIARPTLTWQYRNNAKTPHQIEVSYLTNNITWKADYVLAVNADDTAADLSGWVTLDNKSGAAYRNAKLKLIAGQVNRAEQEVYAQTKYAMEASLASGAPQFQEQAFFEYHIYDLQRPTTVKDNQTKQISLLEAQGVGVRKELLVYGIQNMFTYRFEPQTPKQPVAVYLVFKNAKENKLGMPLPEGVVRVYKQDAKESLQFIGEDRIQHTPKDEEVRLKMGEAFDVVAERRQTDYKRITNHIHESAWEVTLRNHKEQDVTVGVIDPVIGEWTVLESSLPPKKLDAFTLRFDVPVPKNGETKLTYRVRVEI
ncbi:MAG: DUF4139 domain-containing protein [Candidatus Omnitrophica bacterium]|nr:DUF4139 domain-containing protein [Candidatus Omnitrophota bacterium]